MDLTQKESEVVQRLRRKRIGTMKILREELAVSHMTVFRALNKYGYYSSVNHNASYYTLHDIPRFDEDGLWIYRKICFSEHGSLSETLVNLVPSNPVGSFASGSFLQIIVFSIFLVIAINFAGEKAKPVGSFFEAFAEVMYKLTNMIMAMAPYGVYALMASGLTSNSTPWYPASRAQRRTQRRG